MGDLAVVGLALGTMFLLVFAGVHIGVALLVTSFVAMILLANLDVALSLLAASTYSAIHSYVFAVVPLFVLMGAFVARSRAATALYRFLYILFRWVPGGLGVATVLANAVFAAVTGASVASAAVFSKVALPQMESYGYSQRLALGAVAGSSVLGMLIPPSLLMIVYGILTQVSIGALFIGGVLPGLVLALLFSLAIVGMGLLRPALVGRGAAGVTPDRAPAPAAAGGGGAGGVVEETGEDPTAGRSPAAILEGDATDTLVATVEVAEDPFEEGSVLRSVVGSLPIVVLIAVVLGGIWTGLFTPLEAAAIGAIGAFVVGKGMGMSWRNTLVAIQDTVYTTGAIMILLIAALMYSRMLATSGLIAAAGDFILGLEMAPLVFVLVCLVVAVILGAVLDSISILLLVIPVIYPTVLALGVDPLWFGVLLVIAVEVGLLTPPFGMVPFTMVAVVGRGIKVETIFRGAMPFVLVMFLMIAVLFAFPELITWLPGIMLG